MLKNQNTARGTDSSAFIQSSGISAAFAAPKLRAFLENYRRLHIRLAAKHEDHEKKQCANLCFGHIDEATFFAVIKEDRKLPVMQEDQQVHYSSFSFHPSTPALLLFKQKRPARYHELHAGPGFGDINGAEMLSSVVFQVVHRKQSKLQSSMPASLTSSKKHCSAPCSVSMSYDKRL